MALASRSHSDDRRLHEQPRCWRGLAPVTVFDDAGVAYGESKESERDGEFGEGELMGTTVQFIEEKRED
jgi:hypothetical protein